MCYKAFLQKKALLKNMIFDSQRFSFKRVWISNKSNAFRVLQSLEKERLWPYAPVLLTASFSRRLSKTKWYLALVMTYCAALRHTGRSQHLRKCGFCGYSPKGYIGLSYFWGGYPGALSIKVCSKCWIYGLVVCCLRRPLRRKYKAARR